MPSSRFANQSYDQPRHGPSLLHVEPAKLDEDIRLFLADFTDASPESRARLTAPLTRGDFNALIHFCKRGAVFALRERNPERCAEGLMALAAVDVSSVDSRDFRSAAGIVDSTAALIDADRDAVLKRAIDAAVSPTKESLSSFHEERRDGTLEDWGYRIVDTAAGPALVKTEFDAYSPSTDLLGLALRASDLVPAHRYPHVTFTVGTSIAPVWIRSKDARASRVLDASSGTALMSLSAREGPARRQLFNVYFSELASEEDAQWLAAAAPLHEPGVRATVAFAVRRIVCLAVTASTEPGKPSVESWGSLAEALEPVAQMLASEAASESASASSG